MPYQKYEGLYIPEELPKIIVNLFDNEFRHLVHPSGRYSHVHMKASKHVKYVRDQKKHNGITLFTDGYLLTSTVNSIESKYKIGWLMESRELKPHIYENFALYKDFYDFILTHDPILLKEYPDKARYYVIGGCWIKDVNYAIHEKTKGISMIYSAKQSMEGHRLRHQVASVVKFYVDLFGHGTPNPIEYKEEALVDYRYSIIIENTKQDNYITEKLIDCLVTGTIPVYWGCPNVSKFFDMNGIITFNTIAELLTILPTLTPEIYTSKMEAVKHNFNAAKQFAVNEDWLYDNIFKQLP